MTTEAPMRLLTEFSRPVIPAPCRQTRGSVARSSGIGRSWATASTPSATCRQMHPDPRGRWCGRSLEPGQPACCRSLARHWPGGGGWSTALGFEPRLRVSLLLQRVSTLTGYEGLGNEAVWLVLGAAQAARTSQTVSETFVCNYSGMRVVVLFNATLSE